MKKLTGLFSLFCSVVFGQNPTVDQFFPIDNGHSYVEFSVKYMGYAKVKGRFGEFSGNIRYDEKNPLKTSVSLLIKTESIDTDLEFRDNDLKSDNWFDAKKFPKIIFQSKSLRKTEKGFDVTGDLTIRDVTKEIVLHLEPPSGILKDIRADDQVIFTGTTSFDRTHFGVEGKNWSRVKEGMTAVGTDVSIEFSILGKQIKAGNFSNWVSNPDRPAGKIYKLVKEQGVQAGLDEFKKLVDNKVAKKNMLEIVGYMLRLEGKLSEAIAVYEANQQAFPDESNVYHSLGEAYLIKGDISKSRSYFAEAIKKNPDDIEDVEILRAFN